MQNCMNFCLKQLPSQKNHVQKTQHELKHMEVKLSSMGQISDSKTRRHLMAVPSHGGDGDPQWTSHEKSPKWMTLSKRWAGELLKTQNIESLNLTLYIFFVPSSCVLHSFLGMSLSWYIRPHQNTTTLWHEPLRLWEALFPNRTKKKSELFVSGNFWQCLKYSATQLCFKR